MGDSSSKRIRDPVHGLIVFAETSQMDVLPFRIALSGPKTDWRVYVRKEK